MMVNRTDPVPGFRFALDIKGVTIGWFTECSSITVERETIPHPEGGVNNYVHRLPGRVKRFNVTLKHGLANNALWDWLQSGLYDGQVERCNVTVILYNSDLTEARRWDLMGAYPIKWSVADFKTAANESMLETLELAQDAETGSAVQTARDVDTATGISTSSQQRPVITAEHLPILAKKVYTLLEKDLKRERDRLGYR
jgi:phage tail-like protein